MQNLFLPFLIIYFNHTSTTVTTTKELFTSISKFKKYILCSMEIAFRQAPRRISLLQSRL